MSTEKTTTTVTKEYDEDGKLVKEITVTRTERENVPTWTNVYWHYPTWTSATWTSAGSPTSGGNYTTTINGDAN